MFYSAFNRFFLLCALCFFLCAHAFSQTYNFENFSVENGLAQNQILSICQDDRGYIWFGTNNGGVSIYDGTGFKNISQNEGLVNNVVYSIIQSKKSGNMIFGTNGGFFTPCETNIIK